MKLDVALTQRAVPPGSMRYYAWLFTPSEHRDVIAAIFLIENELRDCARAPHEVAHVRLQWWQEEFDRLQHGKAQHPATQVLQAAAHSQIDYQLLQGMHLSAAQELANSTYETDAELTQYLSNGLGNLIQLAAQCMASETRDTLNATANQLGQFIRHVEILRDLRQDFHHGRLFLPLAKLDQLNIEYEALQKQEWPDALVQLLKFRSTEQLTCYQTLKQGLLNSEKQTLRPLLVLSELHTAVLETIATDPNKHTQQRVELRPFKKLWTAWRSAKSC